ncbi:hypothetical protein GIB67_036577, partial [Kingdonia uniflora]
MITTFVDICRADSNEDGRIIREEVQEYNLILILIMLNASANKLSKLKEQAQEYASLIMEELEPENLKYIEVSLEYKISSKDGTYLAILLCQNTLTWLRSTRVRLFVPFDDNINFHKVSVLPGSVFSLVMSKPNGFKYRSGQYIFLQCLTISPFEWHPFSITSTFGNDDLNIRIRTVRDWIKELKQVFTKTHGGSPTKVDRDKYHDPERTQKYNNLPKLLVNGPYGAPAQDYKNYDVLLLVGLGIGATPFISILRDLLSNIKNMEDQT